MSTADSGAKGVDTYTHALASGVPFDLVLVDWRMPGMNGVEVARGAEEHAEQLPLAGPVAGHLGGLGGQHLVVPDRRDRLEEAVERMTKTIAVRA